MGHAAGEPISGSLHSTDASSGAEVSLFDQNNNARTLQDGEYIEVHQVTLISAAGGDCRVFLGDDATPAAGEDVLRGAYSANGGEEKVLYPPKVGNAGQKVYAEAPAGALDVNLVGMIRRANYGSGRPGWKESDFGQ